MLVDTNLLILYLVGEFDARQISRFRRTKQFVAADYWIIKAFFDTFPVKVTTPNILTEVSNLSGDLPDGLRARFLESLRGSFQLLSEEYLPSQAGTALPIFPRFGLTDAITAEIANQRYLVITDDFPLSNYLTSLNSDVINFNHLRSLGW